MITDWSLENALDLLQQARVIYKACLAEGYHPYDEHEERIEELCRDAERIAQDCSLDVHYLSHMPRMGIEDLYDQIEEEMEE